MRYLRDASEEVIIWIDAICIDQMTGNEKTEQIRRMSEIYEGSVETVVWLDLDEHPHAAKFMRLWHKRFIDFNGENEDQVCTNWYNGRTDDCIKELLKNI